MSRIVGNLNGTYTLGKMGIRKRERIHNRKIILERA
jgi:hypothetical protein